MKIRLGKRLFLIVLFLYAISAWNMAGYWFAVLTVMFLGWNLPRITVGFPEILLILFSGFYFLFDSYHRGVSWQSVVNILWGPWAAFLMGKGYVQQTSRENGFWEILFVPTVGFFFHGILNFLTYLSSSQFSEAYAYQRISLDVWQGTVASVTANGLLFSFAAGLSLGALLYGSRKKKGLAALGLMACIFVSVFYANRTLLCIVALLLLGKACTTLRENCWGKYLLGGTLGFLILTFLWTGNIGGLQEQVLSWKLVQRLEEAPGRLYAWSFFFRDWGFLQYPFGGSYLTKTAPTPYLHNLWLDVYNAAGVFPFLMLLLFTLWAVHRVRYFERAASQTGQIPATGTFSCLLGAAFLNMLVEPVLEANPYYFQTVLLFLGAMEGRLSVIQTKCPAFSQAGSGGEKQLENGYQEERDLWHLLEAIFRQRWKILLAFFGGTMVAFLVTAVGISPEYQVGVMFSAHNTAPEETRAAVMTNSDLVTSRSLADSYLVLLFTGETLSEIAEQADVSRSRKELEKMVQAEVVENTELFRVWITSPSPGEAEKIAKAVTIVLPRRISQILEGSVKVADASGHAERCDSHYGKNTALGGLGGLLLAVGVVLIQALFDTTIRREQDISHYCKIPILAVISKSTGIWEAHALLAAKLEHLCSDSACSTIGIMDVQPGSGSGEIAAKLAAVFSGKEKRAVVLETDMDSPALAKRLHLRKTPGLWDYFYRRAALPEILQICRSYGKEVAFPVIPAGQAPEKTVAKIKRKNREGLYNQLKKQADFLLLALPSLEHTADALPWAEMADGILLIVQQNQCSREELVKTIRHLEFMDIRIFGILYQKDSSPKPHPPKKQYSGKYAKK